MARQITVDIVRVTGSSRKRRGEEKGEGDNAQADCCGGGRRSRHDGRRQRLAGEVTGNGKPTPVANPGSGGRFVAGSICAFNGLDDGSETGNPVTPGVVQSFGSIVAGLAREAGGAAVRPHDPRRGSWHQLPRLRQRWRRGVALGHPLHPKGRSPGSGPSRRDDGQPCRFFEKAGERERRVRVTHHRAHGRDGKPVLREPDRAGRVPEAVPGEAAFERSSPAACFAFVSVRCAFRCCTGPREPVTST